MICLPIRHFQNGRRISKIHLNTKISVSTEPKFHIIFKDSTFIGISNSFTSRRSKFPSLKSTLHSNQFNHLTFSSTTQYLPSLLLPPSFSLQELRYFSTEKKSKLRWLIDAKKAAIDLAWRFWYGSKDLYKNTLEANKISKKKK